MGGVGGLCLLLGIKAGWLRGKGSLHTAIVLGFRYAHKHARLGEILTVNDYRYLGQAGRACAEALSVFGVKQSSW